MSSQLSGGRELSVRFLPAYCGLMFVLRNNGLLSRTNHSLAHTSVHAASVCSRRIATALYRVREVESLRLVSVPLAFLCQRSDGDHRPRAVAKAFRNGQQGGSKNSNPATAR